MDNYVYAAMAARVLFLKWDQRKMIEKYHLESDEAYLYIRFLCEKYRIDRQSGAVEHCENGIRAADFHSVMAIYDYLCRENTIPEMCGNWVRTHSLKNAGAASPDDVAMYQKHAEYYQEHQSALKFAASQIGKPFFKGDIAVQYPIFDGMDGVFQFWEGDEEFPPSIRFLWDENIHQYLKFETVWYVCGRLFERLDELMRNFSGDESV